MDTRYVDTEIWINEIVSILNEGYEAPLNITGNSMFPFLKNGRDSVLLKKFVAPAQNGDILLYRRDDGSFILHRVVKTEKNLLWFAGDAQSVIEGPVHESEVLAIAVKAKRNGKWISEKDSEWNFYKNKWIKCIKYRYKFIQIYSSAAKIKGKLRDKNADKSKL